MGPVSRICVVTVDVDEVRYCGPEWLKTRCLRESEAGGFAFERLDGYQSAIEFLVVVARIISELPGGNATCGDCGSCRWRKVREQDIGLLACCFGHFQVSFYLQRADVRSSDSSAWSRRHERRACRSGVFAVP